MIFKQFLVSITIEEVELDGDDTDEDPPGEEKDEPQVSTLLDLVSKKAINQ